MNSSDDRRKASSLTPPTTETAPDVRPTDDLEAQVSELQAENDALRAVLRDAEERLEAQRIDPETQVNLAKLYEESLRQVAQLKRQVRKLKAEAAGGGANRSRLRKALRRGAAKLKSTTS